ncbi:MAG: zinc ribbon domain-containing protein [Planctomycetes bacterium]|nr:zinc ribbon domain-containing protein [Planctomycetota bacterium]
MVNCRECDEQVSENASLCPKCGAPQPYKAVWKGYGFYYKSKATLFGLPLICISFCYTKNRLPIPAVGIIAISQFGAGILNISQIGIGVFSLAQITIAPLAIAQIALAYKCIAQIGFVLSDSIGQSITNLLTGL